MRRLAGLLLAAGLTACATPRFEGLDDNAPSANLTVTKGYQAPAGVSGSQSYFLARTPRCADEKLIATVLWTTSADATVRIPVGRPVAIRAATTYYGGQPWSCGTSISFTPQAGHNYEIVHIAPYQGACALRIMDKTQGAPAPQIRMAGPDCAGLIDPARDRA